MRDRMWGMQEEGENKRIPAMGESREIKMTTNQNIIICILKYIIF